MLLHIDIMQKWNTVGYNAIWSHNKIKSIIFLTSLNIYHAHEKAHYKTCIVAAAAAAVNLFIIYLGFVLRIQRLRNQIVCQGLVEEVSWK